MRSKRQQKIGFAILMLIPIGVVLFALSSVWPSFGARDQTIIVAFQLTEPQILARRPLSGSAIVRSGFSPDPLVVPVRGGGTISAREAFGSHCKGYIGSDPTYSLDYSAGVSSLYITVESTGGANTTLIVHAPDEQWYCDDDSGARPVDASLQFVSPRTGGYIIWVGNHERGRNAEANLTVTEPNK